jgi:hypothetical protein
MWWIKRKLNDEGTTLLPPALALRKDRDDVLDRVEREPSEAKARALLVGLNERIRTANRSMISGPSSNTVPVDIERAMAKWRKTHSANG